MISNSMDHQLRFQQVFWFGLMLISALLMGYFLAASSILVALGIMGFMALLTVPYHSKLSIYLALATFNSALIVPLFPGRPYVWEFAALLGWSGLVLTISMRQYAPDAARIFREQRWLFLGIIGYCLVLLITLYYRGFGLRILGSDQMGGRFYFQQLTCAIFPFLFVMCRPGEKVILRLFIVQCMLTATYLISDFVLSVAPEGLFFLLQFFELSGDAINFEMQAARFGIRRFQSFYVVSTGFFFLLLVRHNLRDFFTHRGIYLVPLMLGIIGLGIFSGHRYLAVIVVGVLVFCSYAQRLFTLKNTLISCFILIIALAMSYATVEHLPLAAQRALSYLPGIDVHAQAKIDAEGTLYVRRVLRKVGMEMAPQYFWVGRGFGIAPADYSWQWDPTTITSHVNQGRFYNGFVGLMVNTGIFGTLTMLLFLGAGSALAWKTLRLVRAYGWADMFANLSALVASLWMSNTIAFLFLHGDSEYAMKTFSLQAGVLICCYSHLRRRFEEPSSAPVPAQG